jgi:hypothetical protein
MLSSRMFFGDPSYFSAGIHLFWLSLPLGSLIWAQTHLDSADSPASAPRHRLFSNWRKMNTYAKFIPNFSGMNTYAIAGIRNPSESTLAQKRWREGVECPAVVKRKFRGSSERSSERSSMPHPPLRSFAQPGATLARADNAGTQRRHTTRKPPGKRRSPAKDVIMCPFSLKTGESHGH